MKYKFTSIIFIILISQMSLASASVIAYVNDGFEKVFIESVSDKETFVLIEGVSPWANKVFKVNKETKRDGESFSLSFDYILDLTSGKMKKTYTPVVSDGEMLFQGSMVKKIKLFFPGKARDGVTFRYDLVLSQNSQQLDLSGKYKKNPFTPNLD